MLQAERPSRGVGQRTEGVSECEGKKEEKESGKEGGGVSRLQSAGEDFNRTEDGNHEGNPTQYRRAV